MGFESRDSRMLDECSITDLPLDFGSFLSQETPGRPEIKGCLFTTGKMGTYLLEGWVLSW